MVHFPPFETRCNMRLPEAIAYAHDPARHTAVHCGVGRFHAVQVHKNTKHKHFKAWNARELLECLTGWSPATTVIIQFGDKRLVTTAANVRAICNNVVNA